jgi:hypothetical protein
MEFYKGYTMQFESRSTRTFWLMSLLGLIPDLLIAYIIAKLTDGGIFAFILTILILQFIYLFIWLKKTIWDWLVFFLGGRKVLSKFIFDFLNENEFPEPNIYENSASSYLESVADNESAPLTARLKAAVELGALSTYASQWKIQYHLRICMAYEDAIEQYKRHLIETK